MPITLSSPFNYKKSNGSYINCLPTLYLTPNEPLTAEIIKVEN
jgi:hypothetical protein